MSKGQIIKTFVPAGTEAYLPANDFMKRRFDRQSIGDMDEANWKKIRCPEKHKRFFAMIGDAYKIANTKRLIDDFRTDLTMEAGFYEARVDFSGRAYRKPKSLAYDKMDQDEFDQVHSRVLDVIIQHCGLDHETQQNFILNWNVPVK